MVELSNRVAVTGPFADINFGDYAMLVNNAYDLNVQDLLLFTYDKSFLNHIERDYFKDVDVLVAEVRLRDGLKEKLANQKNLTPFELIDYVDNLDEIEKSFDNIDMLLVNGGGYFNSLWSMPHRIERLVQIVAPIIIADRKGIKIVFSGNGFGPFGDDSEFFSCLFGSLKNVEFRCRDRLYSPVWLRQLGVCDEAISFVPDDLLLINEDIKGLDAFFSIASKDYIVMETYMPVEFLEENKEVFAKFVEAMKDRYGLSVVFLPFHLGRGGVDQGCYLEKNLSGVEFVDISEKGYLPIQDAVKIIKNAKLVLSNRYHAVIVALQCATPTVSVLKDVLGDKRYYYNKNRGAVDMVVEGRAVNEKLYFSDDYLMALEYVAESFNEIVFHQNENYASVHAKNMKRLSEIRSDFISNI